MMSAAPAHELSPVRRRLNNRRDSDVIAFDHNGLHVRVQASRFPDGTWGEIFIDAGPVGSAAYANGHDAAVAISIGLQHGVPLDVFRHSLLKLPNGRGASIVGHALDLIGDGP